MCYNYLSPTDFERAIPSCRMDDMAPHFLHQLDVARYLSGVPFIVNSAYRTVEHEISKGRDGKSSHTKGLAVDLKATNSRTRFKIVSALIQAGFTRIGAYSWGIHVDCDESKDQEVMWTG